MFAGPAVKFGDVKTTTRLKPPLLGQHTDEILEELGHSKTQIADLRKEGVV